MNETMCFEITAFCVVLLFDLPSIFFYVNLTGMHITKRFCDTQEQQFEEYTVLYSNYYKNYLCKKLFTRVLAMLQ